ncbi:unnamed protein product [Rhizoctonia solani]|uniref:Peptidase C14 caspase domain-containing protein n=1 Tax=Rhizoctonia solani TaxID=456999 RepID=A0A8H2WDX2_9AGAM|nr:unnamed protein product [Rhizoctonia solani]
MVLSSEGINKDLQALRYFADSVGHDPDTKPYVKVYCDKEKYNPADESRVRTVMQIPRKLPTFIYLAGHTETQKGGQLAYAPADCLNPSSPGELKLIPYETIRQWLLSGSHSESLVFVTEVCYCENFLRLPYVLTLEGGEARWEKTEYHGSFEANPKGDVVHFAATSPGEQAMTFPSTGSIFTKAFCYIDPKEKLSLKTISEQLQKNVNKLLSGSQQNPQNPKVYSSRIIEDPNFFAAMGFFL